MEQWRRQKRKLLEQGRVDCKRTRGNRIIRVNNTPGNRINNLQLFYLYVCICIILFDLLFISLINCLNRELDINRNCTFSSVEYIYIGNILEAG